MTQIKFLELKITMFVMENILDGINRLGNAEKKELAN